MTIHGEHQMVYWNGDVYPPEQGDGPGEPFDPILVSQAAYAFSDVELAMEQLNDSLWGPYSTLEWVPLGPDYVAEYGEGIDFDIGSVPRATYVLVRSYLEGGGLESYEVVQISPDELAIPTLSEWAMIVFAVVILSLMTYVVIRRRKQIQPTTA
jgi:hypothetical protein